MLLLAKLGRERSFLDVNNIITEQGRRRSVTKRGFLSINLEYGDLATGVGPRTARQPH